MGIIKFIFVLFFIYQLTNVLGYVIHWCFHQKWAGKFYSSHRFHHIMAYPPSDFQSVKYRSAGSDSSFYFFIIAFAPIMIGIGVLMYYKFISLPLGIITYSEMIIIGLMHNYLHDCFHIKDHWLHKFKWYQNLIALHRHHHSNMKKNFFIFDYTWDKIFKTFKK